MHAVNIEEIRKNIDQHRLVGNDLLDGGTNALNAAGNIALFIRLARGLLAVFQQRQAERQPPHSGQAKHKRQAGQHGHANQVHDQKNKQRNGGAADVTQAVPHGGNFIHAVLDGNIGQKGIVIDGGSIKTNDADDVQNQDQASHLACCHRAGGKIHPRRKRHARACCNAQQHKKAEQLFAHTADIAKHAQERSGQRHDQHGDAGCIAPGGHAGNTVRRIARNRVKKDGEQRYNDNGMGAVGPVVHHPTDFLLGIAFKDVHGVPPDFASRRRAGRIYRAKLPLLVL